MPYLPTADLPQPVQNALRGLGYRKPDIQVVAKDTISPMEAGEKGRRGFFCAVELRTGEAKTKWGSWGGANIFNANNAVDLDDELYPIPRGVMVLKGSDGDKVFAVLYVRPEDFAPLLPPPPEALTEDEQAVLYAFACLKSGPYRQEFLARVDLVHWRLTGRNGGSEAHIESLAQRGYLKRAANGATQITTRGKNVRGNFKEYLYGE